MGGIETHKDLDVWKEAMTLAKEIYELTKNFPKEETYGLVSQKLEGQLYQFQVI